MNVCMDALKSYGFRCVGVRYLLARDLDVFYTPENKPLIATSPGRLLNKFKNALKFFEGVNNFYHLKDLIIQINLLILRHD